jgi:uncharacterized membrane protein
MRTPANIAGHPIHPMLVTLPIGLWIFSLVADLVALRSGNAATWSAVALYCMVGGVVGALLAAVPGLVDLLSLKGRPVQQTAIIHMSINLAVVVLYAVNAWTRINHSVSGNVSLLLSVVGVAMLAVSGWLGGKMVYLAGVAVDTEEAIESDRSAAWAGARDRWPAAAQATAGTAGRWTGERAMATDSAGPAREREDRAAAGARESVDSPRDSQR